MSKTQSSDVKICQKQYDDTAPVVDITHGNMDG
jgi:hypothetical protein